MEMHASWVHGNALTVESPENLERVGHFGWGADMRMTPGKGSWFHISLPTPVIIGEVRSIAFRVFLLFRADAGHIRSVHIWDGSVKVQEFNNLFYDGEHRFALDAMNGFNLRPHTLTWGVGISFFFRAAPDDPPRMPPRLILAAAGGDFIRP